MLRSVRARLFWTVAVLLLVAGCGSRSDSGAAGGEAGRPQAEAGSPGEGAVELDDEFLESVSGAESLDAAVAILYERCGDPGVTDRAACEDDVQQFFESAPIRLVDHGRAGCRADWEAGTVVLAGANCVSAFHLVDSNNEPIDPAALPPDGRLPEGGGMAEEAVKPPPGSASGGGGGTTDEQGPGQPGRPGGGGGTTDENRPSEQFPPVDPVNNPDFNKFEGTGNLEAALRGLYMDCDGDPQAVPPVPPKPNGDKCRENAREFLAAGLQRAVYSTEAPRGQGPCEADWDDESVPPRVVLRGTGCGSAFLLKNANGDLLTDEQIRTGSGNGDPQKGVPLPSGTEVVQDGFEAVAECAEKEEDSDDVASCREKLDETLPPRTEDQPPPYTAPQSVTTDEAEADKAEADKAEADKAAAEAEAEKAAAEAAAEKAAAEKAAAEVEAEKAAAEKAAAEKAAAEAEAEKAAAEAEAEKAAAEAAAEAEAEKAAAEKAAAEKAEADKTEPEGQVTP